MSKISRREFLKSLSMGLSVAVFTACSQNEAQTTPNYQSGLNQATATGIKSASAIPTQTSHPAGSAAQIESPDIVVARNGDPEEMVRQALGALGGMKRFVPKGATVVIKPNICVAYHTYEYAATTNPWVVGTLVKLCIEAGATSVRVMDYPFGGSPELAYEKTGIAEQVHIAGGEMVVMPHFKFISTEMPTGQDLKNADIFDDILKADVLIDVPIAKHHSLARLTLGMKNLMGVIRDRQAIHRNLGQRLADLASHVRPTLTVIDAVRVLMENGPTGGNLADVKQMDTVIVSTDIVAADSYAATLFGLEPDDLSYVRAGAAMGLGNKDLKNLRIEEIAVGA